MVDNIDTYQSFNINIGTVMKNPEMLKFIPDHLKTEQISNYAFKKLPFIIRYVPETKTKKLCDRAIRENGWMLESVSDQYKTQQMCNNAVDNYAYALEFVPDR